MVFYELGNGCDTCETVSPLNSNNINMQGDMGMGMGVSASSMGMPYGTQNNVQKQYNNTGMQSGYGSQQMQQTQQTQHYQPQQSQQPQYTQQATQPSMVLVPATTVSTTTTSNGQIVKQVTMPNTVAIPSHNSVAATVKTEGFTDGTLSNQNYASQHNSKMWIVLGLVIFSALAGNECCKYFLNKSLQLNDGSPLYYVAYLFVAILLAYASYTYSTKP